MNRDHNKSLCMEGIVEFATRPFNKLIISEVADLAYCNGYNTVLIVVEEVSSGRIISRL